jgi:hypothetical protein
MVDLNENIIVGVIVGTLASTFEEATIAGMYVVVSVLLCRALTIALFDIKPE